MFDFDKFLENGIWHCPHCDGFATTDKKLIIIASHDDPQKAIRYAKVFLGWTNDITLFLQGIEVNSNESKHLLTDKQIKETIKLGIKSYLFTNSLILPCKLFELFFNMKKMVMKNMVFKKLKKIVKIVFVEYMI